MFKKLWAKLTGRSRDNGAVYLGDPGKATHSIIRVDGEGYCHDHLVGRTAYGKGHDPEDGHKPDTVIVTERLQATFIGKGMAGDTEGQIPKEPEWYQRSPFDPTLVAFVDDEGHERRYMQTPMDECYLNEPPGDLVEVGTIPPEEFEVRDYLTVAILARRQVSGFEFWWSQFIRPTERYRQAQRAQKSLHDVCRRSPQHRAAICRIANSEMTAKYLKKELRRIIAMIDNNK